jgi:hypothetical protein
MTPTCARLSLLALLIAFVPLAAQEPNPNVRFGLPSAAKPEAGQREDYLIERPQYVLSYNATSPIPGAVRHRSA